MVSTRLYELIVHEERSSSCNGSFVRDYDYKVSNFLNNPEN